MAAAYVIVRFNGRYYVEYAELEEDDGPFAEEPDTDIENIPTDPKKYGRWLRRMRVKFAAKERYFERHVFPISGVPTEPAVNKRHGFIQFPSEIPLLHKPWVEQTCIVNLDCEVFTLHQMFPGDTARLDLCDEDQLASPALERPKPVVEIGYPSRTVAAKTKIEDVRTHWLVRVLAEVLGVYSETVHYFGLEWAPESLPFRELAFALLFIASGKSKFLSFNKTGLCHPHTCKRQELRLGPCELPNSASGVVYPERGWLDRDWAGDDAPLLEFGSLFHKPSQAPGVSPAETMYWLDGVLISLTLVVDGAAVTAAVEWGLRNGRSNFQLVVMSLFKVILAEVSTPSAGSSAGSPFVKATRPIPLSPMCEDEALSSHPFNRLELDEEEEHYYAGYFLMWRDQSQRVKMCRYPGLAALVNFFDVAQRRLSAAKSNGVLPTEMYWRIIDHTDFDTWRTCSMVSPAFRSHCLLKFRIDEQWRILPGPAPTSGSLHSRLSMGVEDVRGGRTASLEERESRAPNYDCHALTQFNWMPIIGVETKAVIVNALLHFREKVDEPATAGKCDEES